MKNMTLLRLNQDSLSDSNINYNKVLVVCATKKENHKETLLYKSLVDQKYKGFIIFHENNKKGLCTIYNQYIDSKWDCVVFVHDDVYIDSCNFIDKIYNGFKTFDICGLAGGSNISLKKPLLWHLMTSKNSQSGVVSHLYNDTYIPTVFGEIGKKVLLLDGLFIAIQPKKLIEKGVKFDTQIKGFHHYDLKFCIDCYIENLTMGTIPVHVIHASPGLREYTKDYLDSEEYFFNQLNELNNEKRRNT